MSMQGASSNVPKEREFDFSDNDFNAIAKRVKQTVGITLASHKKNMVYSRLSRRLRDLGLNKFSEYIALIDGAKGEDELVAFVNAITTNLTHFFREEHHFEHLSQYLEELENTRPRKSRMRIWSAGCSSGMEPYSMAITLLESLKGIGGWDAKILATDIDTDILEVGRQGSYKAEAVEKMSRTRQVEYFHKSKAGEGYAAKELLKRMIYFKQLNLLEPLPMKGPFDAIFCRNVMIYFDRDTQAELVEKFHNVLAPSGFLYIGHSETLKDFDDKLEAKGRTIYQKIGVTHGG